MLVLAVQSTIAFHHSGVKVPRSAGRYSNDIKTPSYGSSSPSGLYHKSRRTTIPTRNISGSNVLLSIPVGNMVSSGVLNYSRTKPHHSLRPSPSTGIDGIDLSNRLKEAFPYLSNTEHHHLQKALACAISVNVAASGVREGRRRVENNIAICLLLGEIEVDLDTLLSGMLAGTLNPLVGPLGSSSAGISKKDMDRLFGRRVTKLVSSAEHVSHLETHAQRISGVAPSEWSAQDLWELGFAGHAGPSKCEREEQHDQLRNLILSEAADWRVVLLRVAAHLQRMRSPASRAQRIALAHEAMSVHAPFAHRLGIHALQQELQDISFQVLHPSEFSQVKKGMEASMPLFDEVLKKAIADLRSAFEKDDDFMVQLESLSLYGRTKEPYSMWKKVARRGMEVKDVLDAVALRVVLKPRRENLESDASYERRSTLLCYQAQAKVEALYTTMESRLKDYIQSPKANGYRSLHITAEMPVSSADSVIRQPFEVQIRTFAMHQQAEYGVAAHWSYKEAAFGAVAPTSNTSFGYQVPPTIQDGREFVNWLHNELQQKKVYVFGPDGTIWDLDKNAATAKDIVSRVSISNFYVNKVNCGGVSIMVKGQNVQNDYILQNGDTISVVC